MSEEACNSSVLRRQVVARVLADHVSASTIRLTPVTQEERDEKIAFLKQLKTVSNVEQHTNFSGAICAVSF